MDIDLQSQADRGSPLSLVVLGLALALACLLTGCGDDEKDTTSSLPSEVLTCDVPPCPVGSGGGGGGSGGGSSNGGSGGGGGGNGGGGGVGGDTDTTGGGGGDEELLSLTGVTTSEDSISRMIVLGTPACIPGQQCLATFTATNEAMMLYSMQLTLFGASEYADTMELFSDCNRVVSPNDTCNASLTFIGMPPDPGPTKRVCLGELRFAYDERNIARLQVCAQSDFNACALNPCR